MTAQPNILAIGGGSFVPTERHGVSRPSGLMRYALDLTGQDRPKLCLVATATGDSTEVLLRFRAAFDDWDVEIGQLALFPMPNVEDPGAYLLEHDIIYVTGGSVANLMALWRLHGLDDAFEEAWRRGIVLAGQSAGALCWHVGGSTDSFGPRLRPWADGLGLVPYSCGVHYNSEPQRRPILHELVASGALPEGYAADEGVGLHYVGTELVQAVSVNPAGMAYRIERNGPEGVKELTIEPRRLAG